MISKELLSEVWKWKYATAKDCRVAGKHIEVTFNETNSKDKINIYELAHKCKEWADDYLLSSYRDFSGKWWCYSNNRNYDINESADTEPEAIFNACQWILNNKGK